MNPARLAVAGCALAIAAAASAQPGTRNAIVYGARAVGETDWHFGDFSLQSPDNSPLTFEIGAFFFRAQGYGFGTAAYKTYVTFVGWQTAVSDGAEIVEDLTNGVPTSGVDGRVSVYNSGFQTQVVHPHNNAPPQPGPMLRVSSSNDFSDAGAAGGISLKQPGPLGNPGFHTADGELGFRFNVTVGYLPQARDVTIDTPLNRVNSFTTFNAPDSNATAEFRSSVVVDAITLHASWVPAPPTLALLSLCGLFAGRRRR